MWQRVQTLYLLIVAALSVLPICFEPSNVALPHAWSLWIVSGAIGVCSLINIFLYRNRILQFRVNLFSLFLCLGYYALLAMMTWFAVQQSAEPVNWHPTIWAAMPLVNFVLLLMATRRILADEALVRSMNRLRVCILILTLAPLCAQADLLDELTTGAFKPKTLSVEEQDSILNGVEPTKYSIRMADTEKIWRHSRQGHVYVRENEKNKEWLMTDTIVRDAVLSPNSRYIAYGRGNNLWLYKCDFRSEIAVTEDTLPIYDGVTDWLYEEEFDRTNLIAFSPDNKYIAYVRLDDREVPMTEWGPYPKAGEKNPKASVCIYDIYYKRITTIRLPEMEESYIPRIKWESQETDKKGTMECTLLVERLNRDQNRLQIFRVNPKSGLATLEKEIKSDTYCVDYEYLDKSANHKGSWSNDSIRYAKDGSQYILCHQSVTTPPVYTLYRTKGNKKVRELLNNDELKARWDSLEMPEKEFFHFMTERGDTLYGWILKPIQRTKDIKRYPLVITQYSGPESRRVSDTWSKKFEYYLAKQGYVVACIDPRGTAGRGQKWLEETYMHLGKKEAEDQIALAQYMAGQPYIDASEISMIGWSYGGFMVIRTMEEQGYRQQTRNEAALIKKGVAIAPVTDWRLYDSAYTERYMRRPQVNEDGYDEADLRKWAKYLTGDLLIIHGLKDDNVHPENTLQLTEALINEGKQFDQFLYPDDNHFLRNGKHLRDVHLRILRFINENDQETSWSENNENH